MRLKLLIVFQDSNRMKDVLRGSFTFNLLNLHSHEPTMIVNNLVALAKIGKMFNIPTILTTVLEERGGYLLKALQDVFPDQKPIDRNFVKLIP